MDRSHADYIAVGSAVCVVLPECCMAHAHARTQPHMVGLEKQKPASYSCTCARASAVAVT